MGSRGMLAAVGSVVVVLVAAWGWLPPAGAEVVRGGGFSATVDGYRGWFGSYQMAHIGTVWCVDHGIPAPDGDYGYEPTELSDRSPSVRAAVAWALGRYGQAPDSLTSAAMTLAVHDLMAASYPSGPLDLGRLAASDLSGFGGNEEEVLYRARAIKVDALAHARLRAPFNLSAKAEQVRPGQTGTLTVRLGDATGRPVAGVDLEVTASGAVLAGTAHAVTDASGEHRFPFVAVAGENRFQVSGTVPDPELRSFAPLRRRAQRVARPGRVPVTAGAGFSAQVRRLSVRKTGDASAYLPLAGARFQVQRSSPDRGLSAPVGQLVTDASGNSASLSLDPGVYQVSELAPPPGYAASGPWTADLTQFDAVVEAANVARPGATTITKVDAGTGQALAGATMALAYDADHDGSFETPAGNLVSSAAGTARELQPGDYELREVSAPHGYQVTERPVRFAVSPGQATTVAMANAPVAAPPPTPPLLPRAAAPPPGATPAARLRPPVGPLPATGRPTSLLALAGSALVLTGVLTTAASGWGARRARRRILARC